MYFCGCETLFLNTLIGFMPFESGGFESRASGVLWDDNCSVYTWGKHKSGKLVSKHTTRRDTQKYDTLGKFLVTILESLGAQKIGV